MAGYISDMIIQSCAVACAHTQDQVTIHPGKVIEFCNTVLTDDAIQENLIGYTNRVNTPLTFDTPETRINFIFLKALLAFGSGYRKELHAHHNMGAGDTMLRGVLSLYLTLPGITTDELCKLTVQDVVSAFNLPIEVDYEVSTGIYGVKESAVKPLVLSIHKCLTDAGRAMRSLQLLDFADLLKYMYKQYEKETKVEDVDSVPITFLSHVMHTLPHIIPGFVDQAEVQGKVEGVKSAFTVIIGKKIQLLLSLLIDEVGDANPYTRALCPDISSLTIFADNVIPAVLMHHGILSASDTIANKINKEEALTCSEAHILRASSIIACEFLLDYIHIRKMQGHALDEGLQGMKVDQILNAYIEQSDETHKRTKRDTMHAAMLDHFLFTQGKIPELRKLPRHSYKTDQY